MSRAERRLAVFLRLSAGVLLLALVAVVLPYSRMDAIHRWLGLGTLADQPMVSYLARSASALYAFLGALYLFISFDVGRYLGLLRFLAWVKLAFGMLILAIDVLVAMPALWVAIEGPFILGWASALVWLTQRVEPSIKRVK